MMADFEQEQGDAVELQPEEAVDIEVQEKIAPFLTGFVTNKEAMEPTKIIKNPEGTLNRAAIAGQEMMKERKLLRERQLREEREKLPDVPFCRPFLRRISRLRSQTPCRRAASTCFPRRSAR